MKQRVLVLLGGFSREREISLLTGNSCIEGLRASGRYEVDAYDFSEDIDALIQEIKHKKPNVVFNASHGTFGEDGGLQHLLDMLGICYTHSSARASYLAFHKHLTLGVLRNRGLVRHSYEVVSGIALRANIENRTDDIVVKPTSEGSSVDVHVLKNKQARDAFLDYPSQHFEKVPLWLVEEYIKGREFTVGVLEGQAIEITEICPQADFYDYAAKYHKESLAEHICPALIEADIAEKIKSLAEDVHQMLGCSGLSRVDIRWDEHKGEKGLAILEVNTQPGMTEVSLVPEQAKAVGLDFSTLLVQLVEGALS